ncbi:Uncharacterized membrane protein [Filomicrobium insigne]|uniref:Uncharacterized membrane protein n=1 Tax=Filomicrobium insigne TaxID=418854 RepID=A0A1H0I4S8_9HYPH|nr:DUF1003 domain-containing protein [Filomicrobium insigne]SDO26363.1 Uncharacterized membrane protein [Filomicrobium insigne]
MDAHVRELAQRLMKTGFDDLDERDRRVIRRIAERVHITKNINREFGDTRTFGQRLADQVAEFGGSWLFIIISLVFLAFWTFGNTLALGSHAFDPYPYIFLNLLLSMLAALQAPIIMMSQNRQAAKDRLAAANDYEVNLKAELEITGLHEKLDDIRTAQLKELLKTQEEQIAILARMVAKLDA